MFGRYYDQHMTAIIASSPGLRSDGYYTNGWPGTAWLGLLLRQLPQPVPRAIQRRYLAVERAHGREFSPLDRLAPRPRPRSVEPLAKRRAEGRADRVYVGNLGGSVRAEVNVKKIAATCRWMNADHQDRRGTTPMWTARSRAVSATA